MSSRLGWIWTDPLGTKHFPFFSWADFAIRGTAISAATRANVALFDSFRITFLRING
jgi:hypothetical protein